MTATLTKNDAKVVLCFADRKTATFSQIRDTLCAVFNVCDSLAVKLIADAEHSGLIVWNMTEEYFTLAEVAK